MAIQHCITVSEEHEEIIQALNLSCSGIFAQRVEEIKKTSAIYEKNMKTLLSLNKHALNFIIVCGLEQKWEDYRKDHGLV